MPFSREYVSVRWSKLYYRIDESHDWELLDTAYTSDEDLQKRVDNVRDINFTCNGISITQYRSGPAQIHETLLKDYLGWRIIFSQSKMSNVQAREYPDPHPNSKGRTWVDIVFCYKDQPSGHSKTQSSVPNAPDPVDNAEPMPLENLCSNYVKSGIGQIKLAFIRSDKESGGFSWAWAPVAAFLVGQPLWSASDTSIPWKVMRTLHLNDYAKKSDRYASFHCIGNDTWQILKKTSPFGPPAPVGRATPQSQKPSLTSGTGQPNQVFSAGLEPPQSKQQQHHKSHINMVSGFPNPGPQPSNKQSFGDDNEQKWPKISKTQLGTNDDDKSYNKGYWNSAVEHLKKHEATAEERCRVGEEELNAVRRELRHAEKMKESFN